MVKVWGAGVNTKRVDFASKNDWGQFPHFGQGVMDFKAIIDTLKQDAGAIPGATRTWLDTGCSSAHHFAMNLSEARSIFLRCRRTHAPAISAFELGGVA